MTEYVPPYYLYIYQGKNQQISFFCHFVNNAVRAFKLNVKFTDEKIEYNK